MEKFRLFILLFIFHQSSGEYYKLTEEQFAMLPPINHLDRFSSCVGEKGGIFCTAYADLVSDHPSDVIELINNYTSHSQRHFDYKKLFYGLCMTRTCKNFYQGNSTDALKVAAEACMNRTLEENYNLKARVEHIECYHYKDQRSTMPADSMDKFVLYVLMGIVALNLVGTLYDLLVANGSEGFLVCFSLRGNWDRLKAPPPSDPQKRKLMGLNGIRVMTTWLVMLGHSPVPPFVSIENPQWLEDAFEVWLMQVLFQGHTITLTFFVMSGFLLTYNMAAYEENHKVSWVLWPKAIFIRWMRLLPVNIILLMITATWFRFTPLGPFWQENVGVEARDCRRYWLPNILYYNNYVDYSTCNLQTWSMSLDMHLHIIGLGIVILSPNAKIRNRILWAWLAVGLVLPALETYFRDLDGTYLITANAVRSRNPFLSSPAFNHTYKRTHTNIPSFAFGMIMGYLVYGWHNKDVDRNSTSYKVFKFIYWILYLVLVFATVLTYLVFLGDVPRAPLYVRVLYSIVQKPLFGFSIALIIAGLGLKIETIPLYSRILEWPIWVPLSKLTYSMFMMHVLPVRYLGGSKTTLSFLSYGHMLQEYGGVVLISGFLGFVVWLFVEAPFGQVVKLMFYPSPKPKVDANGSIEAKKNGNVVRNGKVDTNGNVRHLKVNGKTD